MKKSKLAPFLQSFVMREGEPHTMTNMRGCDPRIKGDTGRYFVDDDSLEEFYKLAIEDFENGQLWAIQESAPRKENIHRFFMFHAEVDGTEGVNIKEIIAEFLSVLRSDYQVPKKLVYLDVVKESNPNKHHVYFQDIYLSKLEAIATAEKVKRNLGHKKEDTTIDTNYSGLRQFVFCKWDRTKFAYDKSRYIPTDKAGRPIKLTPKLLKKWSIRPNYEVHNKLLPRCPEIIAAVVTTAQKYQRSNPTGDPIYEYGIEGDLEEIVCDFYGDSVGVCKPGGNGFFNFSRADSSFCEFCQRDHNSDNTVWARIVGGGKVLTGCTKAKGKSKIIGIIPDLAGYDQKEQTEPKKQEETKEPKVQFLFPRFDEEYEAEFVKPLDKDRSDVLLLSSGLGTGKTSRILQDIVLPNKNKRILYLSPRQIFARSITHELNATLPDDCKFVCYLDVKVKDIKENDYPRLVIQVESLFKLKQSDPYDIVVIDESESVLVQFTSFATNGENLLENHRVFSEFLVGAKKVILADAFLSIRSELVIKQLLPERVIKVVRNTKAPPKRTAYEVEDFHGLCQHAMGSLGEGKKIVFFCASKIKANGFCKVLEEAGINHLAYSRDSTSKIVDVRKEWSDPLVRCVIYTSTITVGVNFDLQGIFHRLYVYGSAMACCVRDLFQGTMRVRHLVDGEMYFNIYCSYNNTAVSCKRADIEDSIVKYNELVDKTEGDVVKETKARYLLKQKWHQLPSWMTENMVLCQMESNLSKMRFEDVFYLYLEMNNYKVKKENTDQLQEIIMTTEDDYKLETVEDITDPKALEILSKIRCKTATKQEQLQYDKYRFLQYYNNLTDGELKQTVFEFWKSFGGRHKTKNVYLEKCIDHNDHFIEKKQKLRIKEIIDKQTLQLALVVKIKHILGITNTHEASKSFTQAQILQVSPQLQEIMADVYVAFGMRKNRSKTENQVEVTINFLNDVLKSWGTSQVKKEKRKRKRVNGKLVDLPPTFVINCDPFNMFEVMRNDSFGYQHNKIPTKRFL